jgi:hypothetical protein
MEVSYKDKLRLVRDEQCSSSFIEKENIKSIFQKGLFIAIVLFILIYLSKL